jgi:hypothetical protein
MTVAELTRDVQFTIDQEGQVTAVVLDPALWHGGSDSCLRRGNRRKKKSR